MDEVSKTKAAIKELISTALILAKQDHMKEFDRKTVIVTKLEILLDNTSDIEDSVDEDYNEYEESYYDSGCSYFDDEDGSETN